MELAFEQLQDFYRIAYEDGRRAKNMCGGLSKLEGYSNISTPTAITIYKVLTKDK